MDAYLIAIELPPSIKRQLSTFCCGLATMNWTDEQDLLIILRKLDPITVAQFFELKDKLSALSFTPFSARLNGVDAAVSKGGRGIIKVSVTPLESFNKIVQTIDHSLKGYDHYAKDSPVTPQVILGKSNRIHSAKLADYLTYHCFYQSEPFNVEKLTLFKILPSHHQKIDLT